MDLKQYQLEAKRTCASLGSDEENLLHMVMGIITEMGELIDAFKKNLAYKKELDLVNIQEEISDATWYLVNSLTFRNLIVEDEELPEEDKIEENEVATALIAGLHLLLNMEIEEQGLLYILRVGSKTLGLDYYQGLQNNIDKLKVRYPEKFTTENALNRDLDAEREQLSK